jgi:hypothetical protein
VSCQRPPLKLLSVAEAAVRLVTEADRDQAVERLIKEAGDRKCLEAVRDLFVYRLHRRSDDFDATYGLQLVITALQRVPSDDASPMHVGLAGNRARRARRARRWRP